MKRRRKANDMESYPGAAPDLLVLRLRLGPVPLPVLLRSPVKGHPMCNKCGGCFVLGCKEGHALCSCPPRVGASLPPAATREVRFVGPEHAARRMQQLVELTEELGLYDDTDAVGEPRVNCPFCAVGVCAAHRPGA